MKHFESRNEFFQKPNFEGIQENKEKFSVNLRKAKRQAGFENYRKSVCINQKLSGFSVPEELIKIERKLGGQVETLEKLVILLGIAVNGKVDNAVQALGVLIEHVKDFHENFDKVPIEISEGLIYNLKLSNKELQENTIIYIDSIFTNNRENVFQFYKTKLFQTLIELLRNGKGLTLPYTLNTIFNYTFFKEVPIDLNSQLLINLFYILENKSSASFKNVEIVIFLFKRFDLKSIENKLALEMAEWLIKFIKGPQVEIVQVSVSTLSGKLLENNVILPVVLKASEDLVNLLEHDIPFIVSNTLLIVQVITSGSDDNTQTLLNLGVLDKFIKILNRFWSSSNRLCSMVAQCISNVFAGTENQILFVLSYPNPIINCFLQQNDRILYREGVYCCANILCKQSKAAILKLIKNGSILLMMEKMDIQNDEDSFNIVKKIHYILSKLERYLDGNEWIELIETFLSNNIYEKIEALLQHKIIKSANIISLLEKISKIIQQEQPKSINLNPPQMFNFS